MVLHLKPPCNHVACDLKRQGTASPSLPRVGPTDGRRREGPAPEEGEVERIKASVHTEAVFSLAASSFCGEQGLAGEGGARRGLRYDGAVQESEGGKRDAEEMLEKGNERTFIAGRASGW